MVAGFVAGPKWTTLFYISKYTKNSYNLKQGIIPKYILILHIILN